MSIELRVIECRVMNYELSSYELFKHTVFMMFIIQKCHRFFGVCKKKILCTRKRIQRIYIFLS